MAQDQGTSMNGFSSPLALPADIALFYALWELTV